ncbi:glycosyltransferase family 4 protein [Micromonospora sp. WMMA1363]|uniref:glycosyltransferase family 4 protein n=1 Tax=Micromonospora sp. WMMA1363 TaxID=3053985 RepID=UPI00259D22F3|nr:glycosyltransferase family 4 protein [Micromonospora sp. WMMA1363]MDM4719233.1 glycosyltransferase family 4 protein [Micromonospora sp. WMMA1363]
MTGTVHAVLPGDVDDPATPSGGNRYDRRVLDGLAAGGWVVHEHPVPGGWPHPEPVDRVGLAGLLDALPDGAVVLLDGLVASTVPEVLGPRATRLRLVVLVHLPLDHAAESAALRCATLVVTTSGWTRRWLLDRYALPVGRVRVAAPGVDPAPPAPGSPAGGQLLCVAAVTPLKGHDTLVDALALVADLPWRCVWVGSLSRDPGFVDRLRRRIAGNGLAGRVRLAGPRAGPALDAAYAAADLLLLASRVETYGMVVTEALARAVPVLATAAGGLPDTLGRAPDGTPPGLLVPPGDPAALAGALRRWLTDPALRGRLRRAAHHRRAALTDWTTTTTALATALEGTA